MALSIHRLQFDLPPERIAQTPLEPRDASRLLVCDRGTGAVLHRQFRDLPALLPTPSLLVVNNTRVRPARLFAEKPTGGTVEVLILRDLGAGQYRVQCSRRKRLHVGNRLVFFEGLLGATLTGMESPGADVMEVDDPDRFRELMSDWGAMPLPPYIHATLQDPERYQTVFAQHEASAAAPTAGLHFTPALMSRLASDGHQFVEVELQVGLGTFEPVRVADLEAHPIHSEWGSITAEAADQINAAKASGVPVIAVGTTTTRLVEHVAHRPEGWGAFEGEVDTFITPGFEFRCIDQLITNFHLPGSTLLALVGAFAGLDQVLEWYQLAIVAEYRFYSFGDAMLIRQAFP